MLNLLNKMKWAEVLGEDYFSLPLGRSMQAVMQAVTVSAVAPLGQAVGGNLITFTIQATADADVDSGLIAHGLNFTPDFFIITPLLTAGALKAWGITTIDATNVRYTGSNVVGSGAATPQVRCWVGRVHSTIR